MNTNVHLVIRMGSFAHHSIQPFGLAGRETLAQAVSHALDRFGHEIGLLIVACNQRPVIEGDEAIEWTTFDAQLGTGRRITVHARETTAIRVTVEG